MSRLSAISSNPTIREYAQGAAQRATQPVADFLAPVVPVSTSLGKYKIYSEKNRFRIPDTRRAVGGNASTLSFSASDGTFNCEPHALDYPVDFLEQIEAADLENVFQEGADAVAEVAALAHEKTVIDAALTAAGAGTSKTWNSSADPVADVDAAILSVLATAGYGSLLGVGVLFGANAWEIFKNQANVRGRFVVGSGARNSGGTAFAVPTMGNVGQLFLGNPEVQASYMVYDSAPEGKTASNAFILTNQVLVFARSANPTRRDPSFMKTFRLRNRFMVPRTYTSADGRQEVIAYDWSEDVKVTNSGAVVRYNVATS